MGMNVVAKIRQATRRKYTAEEKIRIVLEGLRGEIPISELCRREGTAPTMYYRNATLKKALAESVLETMKYKKSLGM